MSLSLSPQRQRSIHPSQTEPRLVFKVVQHPKQTSPLLRRSPNILRKRLASFYKRSSRLNRTRLSKQEITCLDWFTENRVLLGSAVRSLLEEAEARRDRLDGSALLDLLEQLASHLQDQAYTLDESRIRVMINAHILVHPLTTDEANSLPFLTKLLLVEEVVTLAELVIQEIFTATPKITSILRPSLIHLPRLQKAVPLQRTDSEQIFTSIARIEKSIEAIRTFEDIDWETLVAESSDIDRLLRLDPAHAYQQMTPETRFIYKERVRFLARLTRKSEQLLTEEALRLAESAVIPYQAHIGFWFMDDGVKDLFTRFPTTHRPWSYLFTQAIRSSYLFLLFGLAFFVAGLIGTVFPLFAFPLVFCLAVFPALRITKHLLNGVVNSFVPTTTLPALDLPPDLTPENTTLFVIPAFLLNEERVLELLQTLETAYLGNRGAYLHFGLLLDLPDATEAEAAPKEQLKQFAKEKIQALNNRYQQTNAFFLFFRESLFNPGEGVFMAWERKRGKLLEFMRVLRGKKTNSRTELFPALPERAEFVVIVDEDAHVPRDFVRQLIAIHAHPLCKPLLGTYGQPPVHGSTFVQPHVKLWFEERAHLFARILSEEAPTGHYSPRIAETYQDLFGRGNFVGKGSIHIDAYLSSLDLFFPENAVLSHDLLEGSVAGATFASTVTLYDEFPHSVSSYLNRLHRWIRGDWQTLPWLFSEVRHTDGTIHQNRLGLVERYKILDTLIECLVPVAMAALFLLALLSKSPVPMMTVLAVIFVDLFAIVEILSQSFYLVRSFFHTDPIYLFGRIGRSLRQQGKTFRQSCLKFWLFPYVTGTSVDAFLRVIYREFFSHHFLLEWNTAAAAERGQNWKKKLRILLPGILVLLLTWLIALVSGHAMLATTGFVLCFALFPLGMHGLPLVQHQTYSPSQKDLRLLETTTQRIWQYYVDFVGEQTSFLPPDHYQETFQQKIAGYTSVSNIGFYLIAILCAVKCAYLSREQAYTRITQTIGTLERLPRHSGLFYNWYALHDLQPDETRFVSSIDAGNLLAGLITTSSWLLNEITTETSHQYAQIEALRGRVETLIHALDFSRVISTRKRLLSLGFDPRTNTLSPFFYQTLASESRLSVLLAIAKRNLPLQAWNALSRTRKRQPVAGAPLLSWSGTLFEYLMPDLFLKNPPGSLLRMSGQSAYANHRALLRTRGLYGALSESGYSEMNAEKDYRYNAFGLQSLALFPHADSRSVVAPYAIFLALETDPKTALSDLHRLSHKALDRYGFFEAIDYTSDPKGQLIGSYMSHHQGMSFAAIVNYLHAGYIQELFSSHPLVQTSLFLIDEAPTPLTKELFPDEG